MTIGGSLDNGRSWLDAAGRLEAILNNLEFLAGREDRMREIVAARRDLTAEIGATWPVVRARESPQAYRRSAQDATLALRDFIAWLRAQDFEIEDGF
ncbi:MAG: hypothetical protein JF608_04330 [Sphingomonadales bacterium]|nr:hypothetical protein [Sphingomonadales bacterium]